MAPQRTFEELILPSTNPVRTNEPQRTYEEIGVTIDKRRDHKRLAEERRRRDHKQIAEVIRLHLTKVSLGLTKVSLGL